MDSAVSYPVHCNGTFSNIMSLNQPSEKVIENLKRVVREMRERQPYEPPMPTFVLPPHIYEQIPEPKTYTTFLRWVYGVGAPEYPGVLIKHEESDDEPR